MIVLDTHVWVWWIGAPARLSRRAVLHEDPADRIIVATALSLGATLVTKDRRLRRYRHVASVW